MAQAEGKQQKQRKRAPMQPAGYPMGMHDPRKDAGCRCGGCNTSWPLEARKA